MFWIQAASIHSKYILARFLLEVIKWKLTDFSKADIWNKLDFIEEVKWLIFVKPLVQDDIKILKCQSQNLFVICDTLFWEFILEDKETEWSLQILTHFWIDILDVVHLFETLE